MMMANDDHYRHGYMMLARLMGGFAEGTGEEQAEILNLMAHEMRVATAASRNREEWPQSYYIAEHLNRETVSFLQSLVEGAAFFADRVGEEQRVYQSKHDELRDLDRQIAERRAALEEGGQ